ncbi:MAG TPA: SAM-dependent methyltransferase [Streptosporangiaceae bacterium]|nr:SAM-dependent methyltransferase [Streptosporangiaceae bacterium]
MQPVIDTTRPHSARVYDYYLGGKDHFAADRETAEKAMLSWPAVRTAVRENRAFLGRAVRYLASEAGIRQFLDIGTGLPSANNVHEVAQAVAPGSRVVYVDNDSIVLVHARALLGSAREGRTAYIDADLREPERILASPAVAETLDLSRPVALILVAILHFLVDADDPARVVATLLDALPAGSYLVASHVTPEHDPEGVAGLERTYRQGGIPGQARTGADFAALAFRGLDMIDPGVVLVSDWRRPDGPRPLPAQVNWYGGIGRKHGRSQA